MATKNFRYLDMMGEGYHKPADDQEDRRQTPVSANIKNNFKAIYNYLSIITFKG